MPIFISQGRYSREAVRGMINAPEDRTEAVAKLVQEAGGRLLSYYLTFGEHDWLIIAEAPDERVMAAVAITAAGSGGVTDMKTTIALTAADAKAVFGRAGDLARSFRAAGQAG